jgi:hypothetical protein
MLNSYSSDFAYANCFCYNGIPQPATATFSSDCSAATGGTCASTCAQPSCATPAPFICWQGTEAAGTKPEAKVCEFPTSDGIPPKFANMCVRIETSAAGVTSTIYQCSGSYDYSSITACEAGLRTPHFGSGGGASILKSVRCCTTPLCNAGTRALGGASYVCMIAVAALVTLSTHAL